MFSQFFRRKRDRIKPSKGSRLYDVEAMESRRLMSTTLVYSNAWNEEVSIASVQQVGSEPDITNKTATYQVDGLPDHVMVVVEIGYLVWQGSNGWTDTDYDDVTLTAGGASDTAHYYDQDSNFYPSTSIIRAQHTGNSMTVTIGAQCEVADGDHFWLPDTIRIWVYKPTVSISPGYDGTEVGTNNGSVISFTVSRDMPPEVPGDSVPATMVNVDYSGTATRGQDYSIDTTITIDEDQSACILAGTVIDDTEAEVTTETVIATVQPGDDYEVAPSPANSATVTITDDSKWFYKPWVNLEKPQPFATQNLGTANNSSATLTSTTRYYLVAEWRRLPFADISDHYGDSAHFEGHMNWGTQQTYGASAGVDIDLSVWMPSVPVTVSGEVNASFTESSGGDVTVARTQAGSENTLFQIASYALFKVLYCVTDENGYFYDASTGNIVFVDHQHSVRAHDIGWTGEVSTAYTDKEERIRLDEDDPRAVGLSTSAPQPPDPPSVILPDDYPG